MMKTSRIALMLLALVTAFGASAQTSGSFGGFFPGGKSSSGGGSGVTTLGSPSGSNANGGVISGTNLNFSFADGTNPGLESSTNYTKITSLLPQYNVETYGAVANDSTNDSTAFASAVSAACSAGGGVVVIPEGTYDLDSPVVINCSGVYIRGTDPMRTKIRMTAANNAVTASAFQFYNSTVGTSSNLIRDTAIGNEFFSVATAEASRFTAGGCVLIRSLKTAEKDITIAGTTTWTAGSTTVTGSGTNFTTDVVVGMSIRPAGVEDWYTVQSITNATTLVLTTPYHGGKLLTGLARFGSGSATVTGDGTLFSTETATTNQIRPAGTSTWYTIQTIGSNTSITLSSNFAGGSTLATSLVEYSIQAGMTTEVGNRSKHVGEIHKVRTVDTSTGTIDIDGTIEDAYLVTDSANALPVTCIENVGLENVQILHASASNSTIQYPAVLMRNVINGEIRNNYIHDVFYAGIDAWSTVNSVIRHNRIEDVHVTTGPTVYYGVWASGGTRNLLVQGNQFARLRHSFTSGGHGGPNDVLSTDGKEGVQRGLNVLGNASYMSTTAHFDTHQPAEAVSFIGNSAIGAWPSGSSTTAEWNQNVWCIQARADKTIIAGNNCQYTSGGIMVFDSESKDTLVTGNFIRDVVAAHYISQLTTATAGGETTINVRNAQGFPSSGTVLIGGSSVTYTGTTSTTLTGCSGVPAATLGAPVSWYSTGGHGIFIDLGVSGPGIVVSNNEVSGVDGSCIVGNGGQFKTVISNNVCRRVALRQTNANAINFFNAIRMVEFRGNRIENMDRNVAPISITGGDDHLIIGNTFNSSLRLHPGYQGTRTQAYGNFGWVAGLIGNPWPASGSDLIANVSGGNANPVSATVYTVRTGPAIVIVTGGTVSAIQINGTNTALTNGAFRLAPKDTIAITYSVAPTTAISYE